MRNPADKQGESTVRASRDARTLPLDAYHVVDVDNPLSERPAACDVANNKGKKKPKTLTQTCKH